MLEKPQKQRKQKHTARKPDISQSRNKHLLQHHSMAKSTRQDKHESTTLIKVFFFVFFLESRFFFLFVFVLLCFVVAVFTFFFFCQGTSNLHSAQDVRLMSGIQQLPVLVDERNPWYNNSEKYHRVWS